VRHVDDDRFDHDDGYDLCEVPGQLTDDDGLPIFDDEGPRTENKPGFYERTVHREWSFNGDGDGEAPFVQLRRVSYAELAARLRGQPPLIRWSGRPIRAGRSRPRVARRRRTRSSSRAGPDRLDDEPARAAAPAAGRSA
jgi:hypothetical protein